MAIASGKRPVPHQIPTVIVEDGLGEVYKAHDTHIDFIVPFSIIDRYNFKKFGSVEEDHEIFSANCSCGHACECE